MSVSRTKVPPISVADLRIILCRLKGENTARTQITDCLTNYFNWPRQVLYHFATDYHIKFTIERPREKPFGPDFWLYDIRSPYLQLQLLSRRLDKCPHSTTKVQHL